MRVVLFYSKSWMIGVVRSLAMAPGVRLAVISRERRAVADQYSRHISRRYQMPVGLSQEEELAFIKAATEDFSADVVFPLCDDAHLLMAQYREFFAQLGARPVPVAKLQMLERARDKYHLSCLLREHGVAHPETHTLTEFPAVAAARPHDGPWLLKPADQCGGYGFRRFASAVELADWLRLADLAEPTHVVQRWIDGVDMCCNVLCQEGRVIAHTVQRAVTAGRGFRPSADVEVEENCPQALSLVEPLFAALRWDGLANCDLVQEKSTGRILMLEVNARPWATLMASTLSGIYFPQLACGLALREPLPICTLRPRRTVLRFSAMRRFVVAALHGKSPGFSWAETDFASILRDPLPEILVSMNVFFQWCKKRLAACFGLVDALSQPSGVPMKISKQVN